jgi:hypothetical protein
MGEKAKLLPRRAGKISRPKGFNRRVRRGIAEIAKKIGANRSEFTMPSDFFAGDERSS